MSFKAIMLTRDKSRRVSGSVTDISKTSLLAQDGDTLVKIDYSSLNYKDALALTNRGSIIHVWPMIPGVDGVGTVVECKSNKFKSGQKVLLTGGGVGVSQWGCLSQYTYIGEEYLTPIPEKFTSWQAMAIGTAGFTAALCVLSILNHGIKPADGRILVTGATGGVGSFAITLLAKLGYQVVASTGKLREKAYLIKLGATELIDRNRLIAQGEPLQKENWAAVVDSLGSHTLANACAQTKYGGIITTCGLAQGLEFPATVAPFILRSVTLAGIDAVMVSPEKRMMAFGILIKYLDTSYLEDIGQTIGLNECFDAAEKMIDGKIAGRFVVDVNAI